MPGSDTHHELVGLLVTTARAHHAATGGINAQWAGAYAERLVGDVNRVLDAEMSDDELAEWLSEADGRYRDEEQQVSWPKAYVSWLLGESG